MYWKNLLCMGILVGCGIEHELIDKPTVIGQGGQAGQAGQGGQAGQSWAAAGYPSITPVQGVTDAGNVGNAGTTGGTPGEIQKEPPVFFLGTAADYAILAGAAISCANESKITNGDVGISPGTAITGFNPDCTTTGAIHTGDAVAAKAKTDLSTAFDKLVATVCEHNLTGQDLGGKTLAPGVYCFDTTVGLTGDLILDGGGNSAAAWIFQVGTTVVTTPNSSVVVAGNGDPCNVFWKVGSSATLATGTSFQGNIIASASITMTSDSTLAGRALAMNASVTSDHNAITSCSK